MTDQFPRDVEIVTGRRPVSVRVRAIRPGATVTESEGEQEGRTGVTSLVRVIVRRIPVRRSRAVPPPPATPSASPGCLPGPESAGRESLAPEPVFGGDDPVGLDHHDRPGRWLVEGAGALDVVGPPAEGRPVVVEAGIALGRHPGPAEELCAPAPRPAGPGRRRPPEAASGRLPRRPDAQLQGGRPVPSAHRASARRSTVRMPTWAQNAAAGLVKVLVVTTAATSQRWTSR